MIFQKDYRFQISCSREGYLNKADAKMALNGNRIRAYNKTVTDPNEKKCKMAFFRRTISIDEFVELAVSGHAFCNLFKYNPNIKYPYKYIGWTNNWIWPEYRNGLNKGAMKIQMKSEQYFEGSQCVFVDIDYTDFTEVQDFIEVLPLKPTVVYMSYSDKTCKLDKKQAKNPRYDAVRGIWSRRFRLCYVFDEIINGEDSFIQISSAINKMVAEATKEPIQDDCGKRCTQYFNGSVSKEVYVSYCIYSKEDFTPYMTSIIQKSESPIQETIEPKTIDLFNFSPITDNDPDQLIRDMKRFDYDEFMKRYRHCVKYHVRKDDGKWEGEWRDDGNKEIEYMVIEEDYFALPYYHSPLKDGQHRRKTLYIRMCLRRVMFPKITFSQLLYDAYEDLHGFIDNSQDPIDIDCLVSNVKSSFKHSVDELKVQYSGIISDLKVKTRPKKGIIYYLNGTHTISERNTKMKEIRYRHYDHSVDPNSNIKEIAKQNGVSEKTIRRYFKDRNIKPHTKPTDAELLLLIDPNMSIRRNVAYLKEAYEINVSKDRVGKLLKELVPDQQVA